MEWLAKESKTNAATWLCPITRFSRYEIHFIFRCQAYWEWSLVGWLLTSIQWIYSLPFGRKTKKYLDWWNKVQALVWSVLPWSWNDKKKKKCKPGDSWGIARVKNPVWCFCPLMIAYNSFFYPIWGNHLHTLSMFFI